MAILALLALLTALLALPRLPAWPSWLPSSRIITPDDTLITQGYPVRLASWFSVWSILYTKPGAKLE